MSDLNFYEKALLSGSMLLLTAFLMRDAEKLYSNWPSLLGLIAMVLLFRGVLFYIPKIIKRIDKIGTQNQDKR